MPVYLLALGLILLINHLVGGKINKLSLVLNIFLLQSWFSPHPLSINFPGWSLSVEAFFYLMFPFVVHIIKEKHLSVNTITVASLVMWFVTQVITTGMLSGGLYGGYPSFTHDLIFYFPPIHFCSFILGVSGAMWIVEKKQAIENEAFSFVCVVITGGLIILLLNNQAELSAFTGLVLPFGSSFLAPIFLVFIVSIARCRSKLIRILRAKPLVLLGEASFSLYILQWPVNQLYEIYVSSIFSLSPLQNFIVFFIFLTLISILTFLLFEKPALKYIRYSLPAIVKKTTNKVNCGVAH